MLRSLDIRDMLLIDRLQLDFRQGLNVLTGETGAGKSILLDCLGFVLGWRGRADLVRPGAEQGEVTAVFDLSPGHPGLAILDSAGIVPEAGELVLRRTNGTDGRKNSWINERRVSGDLMRQLSDSLVEMHGQNDDRGLLNARGHRAALDLFGNLDLVPLHRAWSGMRSAEKAAADAEAALTKSRADEDYLRHALSELDQLDPQPGEDAEMDARRRMMQAAERIREDVARAAQILGTEGAEGAMLEATRWLEGAAEQAEGRLDTAISGVSRALTELGEATRAIDQALDALGFDDQALEQAEERLFALRALARKHSVLPDELAGLGEDLKRRLQEIDSGDAKLQALRADADAKALRYQQEAARISAERKQAAARLDTAVMSELAPLKMEHAIFETRITASEPGRDGCDEVSFTIATNPGTPAGPLNKVASGGELSRFLLALKVCLVGESSEKVMIFDEIDRGVGGATADAVGRRLLRLSNDSQVLVVTHSPQVAALGDQHFLVSKSQDGASTRSQVEPLAEDRRVDEIARMLSGDKITAAATEAARALIQR